ncbi:hypothetical protein [Mucilaginibacter sp. L3T2-6]|uniref:hypothetical protein n=1 Tax=Mucilaginibacter sp. L3T2-6 TaxID=3062491 RepID=UPI0026771143|nr:hypothetical protein [Mucilaginibacter sp. L3T2-6]MDO3641598.1 hypothetical protein [Mucilaginibacter sp. L3T2-6]MDV6214092.1 hypothetical protein [Mucilaginibacter sp. L3T2-6]
MNNKVLYVEEKEIQNELASIRNLMERSSKFISLSGLSGILAGIYALAGAALAYNIIYNHIPVADSESTNNDLSATGLLSGHSFSMLELKLMAIAFVVLVLSIITGIVFSLRKAKRKGQPIWGKTSRSMLFYMATPLFTGGLLILIFIYRGHYSIIAPASLIFYGLSLVGASNFTFNEIKYLGLCDVLLGLVTACVPGYGLLFWAIGFGVLHIVYGSVMYFKYDR